MIRNIRMSLYMSTRDPGWLERRLPEGRDPAEPLSRVVPVIGMLRRLDMVEKAAIDDGLAGGGDGGQERGGVPGVGTRDRGAPEPQPMGPDRLAGRLRHTGQEGHLIQQGMADPAIAPVDQGHVAAIAAEIAGMEIAMDEALAETAGR